MVKTRKELRLQSIPDNSERRKVLNSQSNPRKEIPNEATQTINPITGRNYESLGAPFNVESYNAGSMDFSIAGYTPDYLNKMFGIDFNSQIEFIEYQKNLARMDVRTGRMAFDDYESFRVGLSNLIETYTQSPHLTLDSITDASGFDKALEQIESKPIEDIFGEKYGNMLNYSESFSANLPLPN